MKKIPAVQLGMHLLEVEITSRCNLNCQHCYNRDNKNIDLPVDRFRALYKFACENNLWTFTISGGEALLHPEFSKIVQIIKNHPKKLRIVLQTNGAIVGYSNIKLLKNFDLIHVSYDFSNELRQKADKNLSLAKMLQKNGMNCYLFVTIHQKNIHLIDKMVALANKNKVDIGFNLCLPVDRLKKSLQLDKQKIAKVEKKLVALFNAGKILRYTSPLTAILNNPQENTDKKIHGGCTAGVAACVVDPSGNVFPCPFLREKAGNIYEQSLSEIWTNSKLFKKLRDRATFSRPCRNCSLLYFCGGCRNRALKHTGKITGADPLCYKILN